MNKTKKPADRLIFHVDVNSAFLSLGVRAADERGAAGSAGHSRLHGSDPAKRTGIVVAKSIPAKKCGVQTGEPVAMALRKCPNMVIVPSDFDLYVKCSGPSRKSAHPTLRSWSLSRLTKCSLI